MPNDPYPGATFMSPSHSATLFVFLPLCLNLTYSNSNGVLTLLFQILISSPYPTSLCCLPYPSIHLLCPPCIHIHFQPTPSIIPPLLFHPGSSPHPFLFATSDYMQTFGFHQLTWLHLISSFSCLCSFKLDTRPRACLFSVCSSFRI